jgi:ubiquinone/menaquinone biosynthesis C-methylase UbiE
VASFSNCSWKDWRPSAAYEKIAEANRAFYSRSAELYEATETWVCSPRCQAELESEMDRVLTVLGKPRTEIRALDACGGSGNISLKLLKRGAKVTPVDISPEFAKDFFRKVGQPGIYAADCPL